MLITVNGIEKEVNVIKKGNVWVCRVGEAIAYWNAKYQMPYVICKGKTLQEINEMKPVIVAYLREYKRLVTLEKKPSPLSFEGEGITDSEYREQKSEKKEKHYVSGVPQWLREVKIKQLCSGPKRTFYRGIRIPQEYKDMAKKYIPFCCNCVHRVNCDTPCLLPEVKSQETLLEGIEKEEMNMSKFYGVKVGRTVGVYTTWADCEAQVKGFSEAQYKGFNTREEAEEYVGIKNQATTSSETQSNTNSKLVTIYTDGACSGNPGPGGWGCILMYKEHYREYSGYVPDTTNNQMELLAAIKALEQLKFPCTVDLYSDSKYLVNGMNQWLTNWKRNNWRTTLGAVKNKELWERLDELNSIHTIRWHYVQGHASNQYNNRCDQLATGAIKNKGPVAQ